MVFNLSLHESITAVVFLFVCGPGVIKLMMGARQSASAAAQEDIELGSVTATYDGGNANSGDADSGNA